MRQLRRFRAGGARMLAGAACVASLLLFPGCASLGPTDATAPVSEQPARAAHSGPMDATDPAKRERPQPAPASPAKRTAQAGGTAQSAPAAATAKAASPASPEPRWRTDASLWDRIREGFALEPLDTPLVAEKERAYLARPDLLERMLERGGRYLFHIVEELERRGMPTELALLPFVESAMDPTAVSPAKAAGLWQFIPSTGRQYNLHQNWWVDNRRDPVKSTQAALDYLQKIHAMHGEDWFLALASYNWGENAVARAVRRNQARGLPAGYLSLDMPAETRQYVPKLIALKNIILRSTELGLALPWLPNRPYFVTIEKTRPIDLELAAQFAGMSVADFVALNPAHNRPVIAASRNNQIKLPADRKQGFLEAVERHAHARKVFASWQPYTLKPGESIESIARAAGVQVSEIRKANGLDANRRIVAGTRILAPHKSVEDEMRVESFVAPRVYEQVDRPAVYHTVAAKETVGSIAKRYSISAASLAAWNDIKQGVRRGMRLVVRPASTQTLLTDEDGDRSVVASAPKSGFRKAVLEQGDTAAPSTANDDRAASTTRDGATARAASSEPTAPISRKAAPAKARHAAAAPSRRATTGAPGRGDTAARTPAPEPRRIIRTNARAPEAGERRIARRGSGA